MKIRRRYRILYIIPLTISIICFSISSLVKFIMDGNLPEPKIKVDIKTIDGISQKVYIKDGIEYFGERLEIQITKPNK